MGGGEMIRDVHLDRISYRETPAKFEAGTPNVGGAIALSAALDYLENVGWEELRAHEQRMQQKALALAEERFGGKMRIFGPSDAAERQAVISFTLEGAHPHDVASLLDARGICVRAGHHCAQPLMERFRVPALTRASPYLYNTEEEISQLFDGLEEVSRVLSGTAPRGVTS